MADPRTVSPRSGRDNPGDTVPPNDLVVAVSIEGKVVLHAVRSSCTTSEEELRAVFLCRPFSLTFTS